jgi:hypothetical protein
VGSQLIDAVPESRADFDDLAVDDVAWRHNPSG